MKKENYKTLESIIDELEKFKKEVHDFDYDYETLWNLDEALRSLRNIIR